MSNVTAQMPQARMIDKIFEEAASTGILRLNGRKLKDVPPKLVQKLDLSDTLEADLSKNRLHELPPFICELYLLSKLCVYSNLLKSLPTDGSLLTLQNLTHLNLSRNQISVIPQALCEIPKLQVLIISHNRLCSLPEELGHMSNLSDLDVSCNEISFLPAQIGDLHSLKYLDMRKNLLVELPIEICELEDLRRLDISENRIQSLPSQLRKMNLREFFCDHNPLITPPSALCTRGLIHIKKFLENEERKRGTGSQNDSTILAENRIGLRHKESLRLTGLRNYPAMSKAKSEMSNYSLPDFQASRPVNRLNSKEDSCATEEIRQFAEQRMEFTRSPRKPPAPLRDENVVITTPASSDSRTICESCAAPENHSPPGGFPELTEDGKAPREELRESKKNLTPEEEFRQKHDSIVTKQRAEALKRTQKEAVIAFVKQRQNPVAQPLHPQHPPPPPPPQGASSPTSESAPPLPSFTIRRGLDRAREEHELQQRMRYIIETRLKVVFSGNLGAELADGVVLCHLANNVRPRSVATIHVPSVATPKLTLAKCRRNVENFLDACRRLGVPQEDICGQEQIIDHFDIVSLSSVVESLIKLNKIKPSAKPPPPPPPPRDSQLSVLNSDEEPRRRTEDGRENTPRLGEKHLPFARNESPVSTSEDISGLDNLEQDQSLGNEQYPALKTSDGTTSEMRSGGGEVHKLRARFENASESRGTGGESGNPRASVNKASLETQSLADNSLLLYSISVLFAMLVLIYLYHFRIYSFLTCVVSICIYICIYISKT